MVLGAKFTVIIRQRYHLRRFSNLLRQRRALDHSQQGFVLPIALGLGFAMLLLGITAMLRSQTARTVAYQRSQMGSTLLVTEGGIARTLMQLSKSNNSPLLRYNYDRLNPSTGKTYLGPDGIPNNGDEENTTIDEWSSLASCTTTDMTYSGVIGINGQYTLKAYRYNNTQNTGTFLVEGQQGSSSALVAVTLELEENSLSFPSVLAIDFIDLLERSVLGANGNVYYDPANSSDPGLTGFVTPTDVDRVQYLDAINADVADNISNAIFACKLTPTLLNTPQGANLGDINSDLTIINTGGGIEHYQAQTIDIDNAIVDIDTTNGPVYLYVTDNQSVKLRNTARIRNMRTDGIPPRVGDLRIFMSGTGHIDLEGPGCIENAFIYAPTRKLHFKSSGGGCPSSNNATVEGVAWVQDIDGDSGGTAGIVVPDDLSSLSDILNDVDLPSQYKLGQVKNWQLYQR